MVQDLILKTKLESGIIPQNGIWRKNGAELKSYLNTMMIYYDNLTMSMSVEWGTNKIRDI